MELREERVRIIQGASADEADFVAGDSVGAPEGDLASRAAGNRMPLGLGMEIISGWPVRSCMRSVSIIAFTTQAEPAWRWHQRQ